MTRPRCFDELGGQDAYELFGVDPDASLEQIRRAYRNAMRTAHPDVGGSEEQAKLLNAALHILQTCRAGYDRHRAGDAPSPDGDPAEQSSGPDSAATPEPDPWDDAFTGYLGFPEPSGTTPEPGPEPERWHDGEREPEADREASPDPKTDGGRPKFSRYRFVGTVGLVLAIVAVAGFMFFRDHATHLARPDAQSATTPPSAARPASTARSSGPLPAAPNDEDRESDCGFVLVDDTALTP